MLRGHRRGHGAPITSLGRHPAEDRLVYRRGEEVVVAAADGSSRSVLPIRAEAVAWRPGERIDLVAAARSDDGGLLDAGELVAGDPVPGH